LRVSSWLLAHDRTDEALQILACLQSTDPTDPAVAAQHHEIRFSIDYEREHAVKLVDLLTLRSRDETGTKPLRRLLLGANTQLMQQFGGVNIITYYLPTILINNVGLSENMSRLLAACNSVSYLVASCGAVPLIDRWGRRGLLLFSTAGQLVSFLIITVLLSYAESQPANDKYALASIVFFFLFYIFFGIGNLGVPWLYPTEINSLPMRTKGAAVATGTNW
jgi:hypothetical protein